MGASPDGLVYDPSAEDPHRLLEIKCLAQASKTTADEPSTSKSNFFLIKSNSSYTLKQTHNYYYQFQGQMLITNRKYGDFVVWNPHSSQATEHLIIERIHYDENFWKAMYLKLKHF